jgi:large subunit ribosomal protein L11
MAEETIELQVKGGQASGGPPLGPKLGPTGINIQEVVAAINEKTSPMKGMTVPVKVHINTETKAFEIEIGTPPTSGLILAELGIKKGSGAPGTEFVADMTIEQALNVADVKISGILAKSRKAALKEVVGVCNSMGIKVNGEEPDKASKLIGEGKWDKLIPAN